MYIHMHIKDCSKKTVSILVQCDILPFTYKDAAIAPHCQRVRFFVFMMV